MCHTNESGQLHLIVLVIIFIRRFRKSVKLVFFCTEWKQNRQIFGDGGETKIKVFEMAEIMSGNYLLGRSEASELGQEIFV